MTEPDVALTDYALMLLCAGFALSLARMTFENTTLKKVWITFFASVSLGSFAGGTVHGFFLDKSSLGQNILWPLTMLSIGITAYSGWILAGLFLFGQKALKGLLLFSVIGFGIYTAVVFFHSQSFLVVIINYLPAMVFLIGAAIYKLIRTREGCFKWVSVGIAISFLAAFIQQAKVDLHPNYFNYNSTYHLVQAFGLLALFVGAKACKTLRLNSEV